MIFVRLILIPVSILYSFIMFIRNKLYDLGVFNSINIPVPVISVGNITTGGTGKTPFTIFIAEYYLEKNLKVGIISRGYKRKSKDLVIVCDGTSVNQDIEMSGDEPVMISNTLLCENKNKYFAVACSDRVNAAEFMVNKFHPDLIILDDGFQHRKINRNPDIVLIDAHDFSNNVFRNLFTIPSGNLRENITNLKRADLIIQNNKHGSFELIPAVSNYSSELISIRYKSEYIMDSKNSILEREQFKKKKAFVFSGLADNGSFIKQLENFGINIDGYFDFPDHYDYSEKDIAFLITKFRDEVIYITTEKDFVKVVKFKKFISDYPVYFLKIGIELNDKNNVLIKMLDEAVK